MGLFTKTRKYSITLSRAISEMETIQFHLTSDDASEFKSLLQDAEDAVQVQADRFQKQMIEAEAKNEALRAARVKSQKKG